MTPLPKHFSRLLAHRTNSTVCSWALKTFKIFSHPHPLPKGPLLPALMPCPHSLRPAPVTHALPDLTDLLLPSYIGGTWCVTVLSDCSVCLASCWALTPLLASFSFPWKCPRCNEQCELACGQACFFRRFLPALCFTASFPKRHHGFLSSFRFLRVLHFQ